MRSRPDPADGEKRRKAYAELDDTIRRLGVDLGLFREGELVTSWVLVGHAVLPDTEDISAYFLASAGGNLPTHEILGLLRQGQRQAEDDEPEGDLT